MSVYVSSIFKSNLRLNTKCVRYPTHHPHHQSSRVFTPRLSSTVVSSKPVVPSSLILPVTGTIVLRGFESLTTNCEASIQEPVVVASTETVLVEQPTGWKKVRRRIRKAFRLWRRFVKLLITLTPVAALYPLQSLLGLLGPRKTDDQNVHDVFMADNTNVDGPLGWYLDMCLYCVECSGAAVVKLMQWAGSRPDLFGRDFCAVFSRLQDDTTPHSWRHTERVMKEAYGKDWRDRIKLGKVIGSGCIGQVYEGTVEDGDGNKQRVAVKGW